MTVRIRGIYATALTVLLDDVVQPSSAIEDRVEDEFQSMAASARVETTKDRQGVAVHGNPDRVAEVTMTLESVNKDAFHWPASLPLDGVFAGKVTETLGNGAIVDVGRGTGYLPYSVTGRRIETNDRLRVQVVDPAPPWTDDRPVLDTAIRLRGGLVDLLRDRNNNGGGPALVDILPVDPPEGWVPDWPSSAPEKSQDVLVNALEDAVNRAQGLDEALNSDDPPASREPGVYWEGTTTDWVWFGRESRFSLDEIRRKVVPTMTGHHRLKAATESANAAVDFVEAVCPDTIGDFPFDVSTRQFGPFEGDRVAISHGKPDGRRYDLGTGEVVNRDPDGKITVHRKMSPGGTYDGLDIDRQAGDVAVTTITEGHWWYPTVYQSDEGKRRGTYVNICTPVEIFPNTVRYVDLHVDVIKHADGRVERVDDDELNKALNDGQLSPSLAKRAREVAAAVESAL